MANHRMRLNVIIKNGIISIWLFICFAFLIPSIIFNFCFVSSAFASTNLAFVRNSGWYANCFSESDNNAQPNARTKRWFGWFQRFSEINDSKCLEVESMASKTGRFQIESKSESQVTEWIQRWCRLWKMVLFSNAIRGGARICSYLKTIRTHYARLKRTLNTKRKASTSIDDDGHVDDDNNDGDEDFVWKRKFEKWKCKIGENFRYAKFRKF